MPYITSGALFYQTKFPSGLGILEAGSQNATKRDVRLWKLWLNGGGLFGKLLSSLKMPSKNSIAITACSPS